MPRPTKRQRFAETLGRHGWTAIAAAEWTLLREELPDVSEGSLRAWLRETAVSVEQPFRGVDTSDFAALEDSLLAMTEAYLKPETVKRSCRQAVIACKDRAKFAAKNPKVDQAKRAEKQEMARWMLVWLDDPAMFPAWAALRRARYPIP